MIRPLGARLGLAPARRSVSQARPPRPDDGGVPELWPLLRRRSRVRAQGQRAAAAPVESPGSPAGPSAAAAGSGAASAILSASAIPSASDGDGSEPAAQTDRPPADDHGDGPRGSAVSRARSTSHVKDDGRFMIILHGLSPTLTGPDFFRLAPKEVNGERVIRKFQQQRHPATLEPLGRYHISFVNPMASRLYADHLDRLHRLARYKLQSPSDMWESTVPRHLTGPDYGGGDESGDGKSDVSVSGSSGGSDGLAGSGSSVSGPDSSVSGPDSSVSGPESSVSGPENSTSGPDSSVSDPDSSVPSSGSRLGSIDISLPDNPDSSPDLAGSSSGSRLGSIDISLPDSSDGTVSGSGGSDVSLPDVSFPDDPDNSPDLAGSSSGSRLGRIDVSLPDDPDSSPDLAGSSSGSRLGSIDVSLPDSPDGNPDLIGSSSGSRSGSTVVSGAGNSDTVGSVSMSSSAPGRKPPLSPAAQLRRYTLAPGSLPALDLDRRRIMVNPWVERLRAIVARAGHGDQRPVLLLDVYPPNLSAQQLFRFIRNDGFARGSRWHVSAPHHLLPPGHSPDPPAEGQADAGPDAPDALTGDMFAFKDHDTIDKMRGRFVVVCANEVEARRFLRRWNQRTLTTGQGDWAERHVVQASRIHW